MLKFLRTPFRRLAAGRRLGAARRRCILHVGSPRTATSTIQFMLKTHRTRFQRHGILVPQAGQTDSGSHRHLVAALTGSPAPDAQALFDQFAREVRASDSDTVLISSEFLWDLPRSQAQRNAVMERLRSLNLDVTIQMCVRNQPQCLNSFYQHYANFRRDMAFQDFIDSVLTKPDRYLYSYWVEFAEAYDVALQVRPFSAEVRRSGVVEDFLADVGGPSLKTLKTAMERNRSMGPFRLAVAQSLMRGVVGGRKLDEDRASRCRRAVRREIAQRGIEDSGYCGLATDIAARIEERFRADNDRFARQVWGRPWQQVFAHDVGKQYEPNDYAMTGVPPERRQLLREVVDSVEPEIRAIVGERD